MLYRHHTHVSNSFFNLLLCHLNQMFSIANWRLCKTSLFFLCYPNSWYQPIFILKTYYWPITIRSIDIFAPCWSPKLCEMLVKEQLLKIIKCISNIMVTFSAHWIHHSCRCLWENRKRLGKRKKTYILTNIDTKTYQDSIIFQIFFELDKLLLKESQNRF